MADDSHRLTWVDGERDVAQDPVKGFGFSFGIDFTVAVCSGFCVGVAVVVSSNLALGEPDMIKLNAARALSLLRQSRRGNLDRSIQQFENALAGRHGALENVVFIAQV